MILDARGCKRGLFGEALVVEDGGYGGGIGLPWGREKGERNRREKVTRNTW